MGQRVELVQHRLSFLIMLVHRCVMQSYLSIIRCAEQACGTRLRWVRLRKLSALMISRVSVLSVLTGAIWLDPLCLRWDVFKPKIVALVIAQPALQPWIPADTEP